MSAAHDAIAATSASTRSSSIVTRSRTVSISVMSSPSRHRVSSRPRGVGIVARGCDRFTKAWRVAVVAVCAVAASGCGSGSDDAVAPSEPTTATTEGTVTVEAPMSEWTIHAPAYGDEGMRWGDLRATLTETATPLGVVWVAGNGIGYMERDCTGIEAGDLEPTLQLAFLVCVEDL